MQWVSGVRRELKFMNFGRWFLFARVGEVYRGYRPGLDRNRFGDRAEAFMPGLKGVGTGRHFIDLECTGRVGNREIGIRNDSDVCVHPVMNIALEMKHDLFIPGFELENIACRRLTDVKAIVLAG